MASWRNTASQLAQDDLDGLLKAALPFATQQLDQHGEFYPYGVALDEDGHQSMFGGDPGQGERPVSTAVRALLIDGMRQKRASLRAVAIVSDVRSSDTDAIRVELEHREGPAIAVLQPYKKKRFGRGVEFGGLAAQSGSPQVWGAQL